MADHQDRTEEFSLTAQEKPAEADASKKPAKKKSSGQSAVRANPNEEVQVISYRHDDRRKNNPEVGMVNETTDPYQPKTVWKYDPHLDPELQFDSQRARVENLLDDVLAGLSQKDEEILSWLDHALAGQDEKAVREVISGLRQRLTNGIDGKATRESLEQLKQLQTPYLNWAGKAERTSFEVDTVSLHVHERIDPASILAAVRKVMKGEKSKQQPTNQMGLFNASFENLPLRDAIDFYKHDKGWSNRLIAGDSLLVMNSLLQKESMAGQVQMIYIDPPYGIKYGSNFQPFVNKRDVKDRKDEDLTQEPEMIKAFRDTWELGIHSYLTYLRDRLLLSRELLHESGSVFVQIGDENCHYVKQILDEIFGSENFSAQIAFKATDPLGQKGVAKVYDYLIWYAKDISRMKFRQIYKERNILDDNEYRFFDLFPGESEPVDRTSKEFVEKVYRRRNATSSGFTESCTFELEFEGKKYAPPGKKSWSSNRDGMIRTIKANRIFMLGKDPYYKQFQRDFPLSQYENCWTDKPAARGKQYVVETAEKFIERCLLMATDPGDLVLDPTCGSGTTAFVAEKWGRRWVTCDTSRVAVTLAKQRLMTANYDYFELKYPHEGLRGGFIYRKLPHVTLKSIANNPEIDTIYDSMHPEIESALSELNAVIDSDPLQEWEVPFELPANAEAAAKVPFEKFHAARQAMQKKMDASIAAHADQEILYDQPAMSKNKLRITGPFSVEAVPFPTVLSLDETQQPNEADLSIARSGESHRQHSWRDELLKTGIRGKGGQMLKFTSLETLPGTACLHVTGTVADTGERVVVSFGPEHGALEQRQVEHALNEAAELFPRPKMIVFCAFMFDPEAAKDIDNLKGITALKAQMNTDMLTDDLKKNRSSNQSFWLMGQPDVEVRNLKDGLYQVEVNGFDYFNTKTGELEGGGKSKIAVWMLDTDYDERSLLPRQVFFPMAGKGEGWEKLKKNIRAELDESKLEQFHGTVSLPFEAGDNRKIAVKIVDDRGIESLKVIGLPQG
jgi:adenine-specific DNA-methyltransferase